MASTLPPAKFLDKLYLEDVGGGRFMLERRLRFYSHDLDMVVSAPAAFETDLASTPNYVPGWIIPKLGGWDYPAVIHDAGYHGALTDAYGRKICLSKDKIDGLFREGMAERGVNVFQRNAMYYAVHWFGRSSYKGAA